ncbi:MULTISPECIES: MarR family transcriptional regulator [Paenibacillus]|uniref:MarR family transcriptional regulator n=1 Tax=Paenibacillus TaxID=44249 RepID=UPI002115E2FF|nr:MULTISPECIES: MarR family transcriptional regulator [Paenibacillus]
MTQLHILSLVNENPNGWNNTLLSTELNVSKPAVTKAVNALIENDLLLSTKKAENNKEVYYDITHPGRELAVEHDKLHKIIEGKYYDLFRTFSEEELDVVIRFLDGWSKLI